MSKKRKWLWVTLFVWVAILLSALTAGWNLVLVRDYEYILKIANSFSLPEEITSHPASLFLKMILGTLGFMVVLTLTILLFIKLLNEMRLNQLQSEFLATVSHELKTPIATLELSSSLIQAGGLSETELHHLWQSHQEELRRLREEVETLLEAARWQSKPSLQSQSPLVLESWIVQSLETWKKSLGTQGQLRREGEPLLVSAALEVRALNLIMNNLLSNARKFARGFPDVTIRTQRVLAKNPLRRNRWQIQIQDQGWGFDPVDTRKIFNRFFRSKPPTPYAIPGTGLGLYLAQSASRALGLTLRGESRGMGLGATFTLEGKE